MNLIKNRLKTPDEWIVYLVMAIELEVKIEQFRLCFMSQNRAVVENKRVLPVLVPGPGTILLLLAGSLLGIGTLLNDENFPTRFRIGRKGFLDENSRFYTLVQNRLYGLCYCKIEISCVT